MTQIEIILKAALELSGADNAPFNRYALSVECWRLSPEQFGIKGFPQYPDTSKVFAIMSHKSKPIANNYLQSLGNGMYRLTDAGRGMVERSSTLPAPLSTWLRRVLQSAAWRNAERGVHVGFDVAVELLGDSAGKRVSFMQQLWELDRHVEKPQELDGKPINQGVVNRLRNLAVSLGDRYEIKFATLEIRQRKRVAG